MDFLCEIAVHEIALDGPAGLALPRLWDLLERRVGDAPHDVAVQRAVYARLQQLDDTALNFFLPAKKAPPPKKDAAGKKDSDEPEPPEEPERIDASTVEFAEATTRGVIIKATIKMRIFALGMEFGFSTDSTNTVDVKKQAFRMLSLVGKARVEGVQQTLLGQLVGVDSGVANILLNFAERRNLISKLWTTQIGKWVTSKDANGRDKRATGARVVYMKRLIDRKVWPMFYSGLQFSQGVTATMKRAQAVRVIQRSAPALIDSLISKSPRIPMMKIINNVISTLLRDMQGIDGMRRQLKHVFVNLILGVLQRRKSEFVVVRDGAQGQNYAALSVCRREDAHPDEVEERWVSMMQGHELADREIGINSEDFRLQTDPNSPLFVNFVRQIMERSPVGLPRHCMLPFESKMGEACTEQVKQVHGIIGSGCSFGKQQHVVFFAKKDLADNYKSLVRYYTPGRDPTLFPSKAAFYDPSSSNVVDSTVPAADPAAVQESSKEALKHLSQTIHYRANPIGKARKASERVFLMHGTYPSWGAGVGRRGEPAAQWTPKVPPLPPRTARNRPRGDDCPAATLRARYWYTVHLEASVKSVRKNAAVSLAGLSGSQSASPSPSPSPSPVPAKLPQKRPRADKTEDDADGEGEPTAEPKPKRTRPTGNLARATLTSILMDKLRSQQVASRNELQTIVAVPKLLEKILTELKEAGSIVVWNRSVTLYVGSKDYALYSIPSVSEDSQVFQEKVRDTEVHIANRSFRAEVSVKAQHTYLEDLGTVYSKGAAELPIEMRKDDVAALLYTIMQHRSDAMLRDPLLTMRDVTRRPALIKAIAFLKLFYSTKNGMHCGRIQRIKVLHGYLLSLAANGMVTFTIRDLLGGMTLDMVAQLMGLSVNLDDMLDGTAWTPETAMQTPVHKLSEKIQEYVFPLAMSRREDLAHFTALVKVLWQMRLIRRVGGAKTSKDEKQGAPDAAAVSDDAYAWPASSLRTNEMYVSTFTVCNAVSIRPVLRAESVPILAQVRKLDYEGLAQTGWEEVYATFWDLLRTLCLATTTSTNPDATHIETPGILGSNVRYGYSWDGSIAMAQSRQRLVEKFKKMYPKDHKFTAIDCLRLSMSKAKYSWSYQLSCLYLVGSVRIKAQEAAMCRALGIERMARSSKTKKHRTRVPGVGTAMRKDNRKEDQEARAKRLARRQEKSVAATKTLSKGGDEDADAEGNKEGDAHDSGSEALPHEEFRWATPDNILRYYEAIVRGLEGPIIEGNIVLSRKHALVVSKELGVPVDVLMARYRYMGRRLCHKLLTRACNMLFEYNARCGLERNTSLGWFLRQQFYPTFNTEDARPLPETLDGVLARYYLMNSGEKTAGPLDKPSDSPKMLANLEAIKMIHLCSSADYDKGKSRALLQAFSTGLQGTLMQSLGRFTYRSRSETLLTKARRELSMVGKGRHYHFTKRSERCMMPTGLGFLHYRDSRALHARLRKQRGFRPHELVTGGQLAYIAEEASQGRLRLQAMVNEDTLRVVSTGSSRIGVAKSFSQFLDTSVRRNAKVRGNVYFIPSGIECVRVGDEPPAHTFEEDDDAGAEEPLLFSHWGDVSEKTKDAGEKRTAAEAFGLMELQGWNADFTEERHAVVEDEAINLMVENEAMRGEGLIPEELVDTLPLRAMTQYELEQHADDRDSTAAGLAEEWEEGHHTDEEPNDGQSLKRSAADVEAADGADYFLADTRAGVLRALARAVPASWLATEWCLPATCGRLLDRDEAVLQYLGIEDANEFADDVGVMKPTIAPGTPGGVKVKEEPLGDDAAAAATAAASPLAPIRQILTAACAVLHKAAQVMNTDLSATPLTADTATALIETLLGDAVREGGSAAAGLQRWGVWHAVRRAAVVVAHASLGLLGACSELVRVPHADTGDAFISQAAAEYCLYPDRLKMAQNRVAESAALKMPAPPPLQEKPAPAPVAAAAASPSPEPEDLSLIAGDDGDDDDRSASPTPASGLAMLDEIARGVGTCDAPQRKRDRDLNWRDDQRPFEQRMKHGRAGRKDVTVSASARDGGATCTVSRPLSMLVSLDGSLNEGMLRTATLALYDHIVVHPGQTAARMSNEFVLYSRTDLQRILDHMVCGGLLYTQPTPVDYTESPIGLFSNENAVPRDLAYYAVPGRAYDMHLPRLGNLDAEDVGGV